MANSFSKIALFFSFPACVLLFHLFASFFGVYDALTWFDIPMHFLGGFSVSYTCFLFLNFFKEKKFLGIEKRILFIFLIVVLVSFVAVLWEFFEFFLKTFFDVATQPSVQDTMADLFMGLFGAFVGGLVWRK